MAATKRKRSSGRSYRRSYKRSRSVSTGSVVRALAKANRVQGPFGPGTENFARYGPSRQQMLDNTGLTRTADQNMNRILDNYYGDGDYRNVAKWGSRLGGAAIGAASGYATGGLGGLISGGTEGFSKGAEFSRLMGWGDYSDTRISNQIVGVDGGLSHRGVTVNDDLSGDIILSNREFVGNLVSTPVSGVSTPFQIQEYTLNPGFASTFPFLSQIARNYEMYSWEGLVFQYIPTTGESSSVGANNLGKIIMATKYDPNSTTAFRTAQEMQNYEYANSAKPSIGQVHGIETAPGKMVVSKLYVREGDADTRDRIFTDVGKLYVGTEGIPHASGSTTEIINGELWVTYKVRLMRSKLRDFFNASPFESWYISPSSQGNVVVPANTSSTPKDYIPPQTDYFRRSKKSDRLISGCRQNGASAHSTFWNIDKTTLPVGSILKVTVAAGDTVDLATEYTLNITIDSLVGFEVMSFAPGWTTNTHLIINKPTTTDPNNELAISIAYLKVIPTTASHLEMRIGDTLGNIDVVNRVFLRFEVVTEDVVDDDILLV